jgi:hypothetical protein
MLTITEIESKLQLSLTGPVARLENKMAIMEINGQKTIIAIGGPDQWASREPLPVEATLIDLLAISINDPKEARVVWHRFISYMFYQAEASKSVSFAKVFAPFIIKLPVRVCISDPNVKLAVQLAVKNSGLGFRMEFL